MAKLKATEMLAFVADEAIQIHGGMGLMDDLPLERIWRDARVERIWEGTSEIQRHIISRALLRRRVAELDAHRISSSVCSARAPSPCSAACRPPPSSSNREDGLCRRDLAGASEARTRSPGVKAYRSVADLPGAPDAAFVGVNRFLTLEIVRDAARRAAPAARSAMPPASSKRQRRCRRRAAAGRAGRGGRRDADHRAELLRPDQLCRRRAAVARPAWRACGSAPTTRGVGIITQSSNIACNLTMQKRGLPIAFLMTAGNQAQTGLSEMALGLVEDERVSALGLHIEGFDSVAGFERLAARARELEEADRGDEGRPLRAGARRDDLAHRLAGRLGRGVRCVPQAARHRARRLDPVVPGNAEAAARDRPACRPHAVVDELLGRRGLGHGRQRRRPSASAFRR